MPNASFETIKCVVFFFQCFIQGMKVAWASKQTWPHWVVISNWCGYYSMINLILIHIELAMILHQQAAIYISDLDWLILKVNKYIPYGES